MSVLSIIEFGLVLMGIRAVCVQVDAGLQEQCQQGEELLNFLRANFLTPNLIVSSLGTTGLLKFLPIP